MPIQESCFKNSMVKNVIPGTIANQREELIETGRDRSTCMGPRSTSARDTIWCPDRSLHVLYIHVLLSRIFLYGALYATLSNKVRSGILYSPLSRIPMYSVLYLKPCLAWYIRCPAYPCLVPYTYCISTSVEHTQFVCNICWAGLYFWSWSNVL
jgi:hypothetical protein